MTAAEKKVALWLSEAAISQSQFEEFKETDEALSVVDVELDGLDLLVTLGDGSRLRIARKSTDLPQVDVLAKKEYWTLLGITLKIHQWVMIFTGIGVLLVVVAIILIKRLKS